jgi:hypothetical protein
VLLKHNIKAVGLLPRKLSSFLLPGKDDLALRMPGVYSILCKHGKVYIGQTHCSIETRVREHHQHIRVYHPDKSTVAEYSTNLGHYIQLQNTSILAKKFRCMDLIKLHPNNMNKEDGFSLIKSWKPPIHTLKECKQALSKDIMHTSLHPSSACSPCEDLPW